MYGTDWPPSKVRPPSDSLSQIVWPCWRPPQHSPKPLFPAYILNARPSFISWFHHKQCCRSFYRSLSSHKSCHSFQLHSFFIYSSSGRLRELPHASDFQQISQTAIKTNKPSHQLAPPQSQCCSTRPFSSPRLLSRRSPSPRRLPRPP